MRVAVISDIHANLHALEAVLAELDRDPPEELWCLGDLVGYGPRPNECCRVVAERADVCLIGNHDLVALGSAEVDIEEFNPDAGAAARWTQQTLSDESRALLERLQPTARRADVELFHGSPRDPVWEYVLSAEAAVAALERTTAPLVLVGHSHVALAIGHLGDHLSGGLAPAGTSVELPAGRWLLNPGSVGQPRDSDPRAAYLALDLEGGSATFHRIPYAIGRTQAEMREAGLPEPLATRLAFGQ